MKQILTINKPNIMKKSKYQQYFCFIVRMLVPYAIWFSSQQNIVTIRISTTFRGALLIRGKHLFQCGYPKVWLLLEGDAYLRSGAYSRKYVMSSLLASDEIPKNFSCRTEAKNGHFTGISGILMTSAEICHSTR